MSAEQAGVDYDARVRAAEDAYTAAYVAARARHDERVTASERQLEDDVTPAREARDTEAQAALDAYRQVLGIDVPDDGTDLPADVVEKFDADTAAAEEAQA